MTTQTSDKPETKQSFLMHIREYMDTLLYAFMLAMLIRTFVAEPYVIPSGSMTPTLLGNYCVDYDIDNDGDKDLITRSSGAQVFFRENGKFTGKSDNVYRLPVGLPFKNTRDKIIVTKFNYWFRLPNRGDIVIFKVPKHPDEDWDAQKPIYIKRVTGLPEERIAIRDGRIQIDGTPVESSSMLNHFEYTVKVPKDGGGYKIFEETPVPEHSLFVFGDNSKNSYDSRAWGAVPNVNVRGKALFRFHPFPRFGFLH